MKRAVSALGRPLSGFWMGSRRTRTGTLKSPWLRLVGRIEFLGPRVLTASLNRRPGVPEPGHGPLGRLGREPARFAASQNEQIKLYRREQVHSLCVLGPPAGRPIPRYPGRPAPRSLTRQQTQAPQGTILLGGPSFFGAGSAFLCDGFGSAVDLDDGEELKRSLPRLWLV